jgi:hypothetical protein
MTGLFLEHRLRSPCDTCLRLALHYPQRRLPMMDVRQHGRPVGDFGAVDCVLKRVAASMFERGLGLSRDPFECWIRHRKPDVRLAEIRKSNDMGRIARRHHNGQRICHVRYRRCLQKPVSICFCTAFSPARYTSAGTVKVMFPTVTVPPLSICFTSRPGGMVYQ